jgi:hypothetical protein
MAVNNLEKKFGKSPLPRGRGLLYYREQINFEPYNFASGNAQGVKKSVDFLQKRD